MVNQEKQRSRVILVLILGSLSAMGALSIDMYLPAFAGIAAELDTDVAGVSLSLSSFFLGLAIGQVIYGPLLERYGRKVPMYFGLLIYIASAIGCALSTSIEWLIIFRFFQALGACGGLVASRAIVRDLFETKDVAKVFSMLMMVIAVSPIIAPTVGGLIATTLGWRYVFGLLALLTVLILASSYFLLPEGKGPDKDYPVRIGPIVRNYISLIKEPSFIIYVMTGAIAYAGLYAYLSGSPHLYLEIFNVTENQYGLVFALIATGLITASQVNNLLLRNWSSQQIVLVSLTVQSAVGLVLFVAMLMDSGLLLTTILIFAYLSCLGFIFPNASALSLERVGHVAGNASALMGSIQMVIGAAASGLVSTLSGSSSMPMAVIMSSCAVCAWLLLRRAMHRVTPALEAR